MKEAIITDMNGLYTDVTIVSDTEFGVTPLYEIPTSEYDHDTPANETPEPVLVGYRVAVPVPAGLYKPHFDLVAWNAWQDVVLEAQSDYADELHDWREQWAEGEKQGPEPVYTPPVQPDNLWVEGLTPEEIAELTKPGELSEIEMLKKENMLLKAQNNAITERADFIEDIIAEMAMQIYQ
ncbi:hypothetical protein [Paenibacillus sp. FSL R5-0908]|uniref:hypothetical protein n=1 Tax=Paenibacillus sp. FSL R5-0908 TaxID=2921664 RepID=UPI0030F51961